jgi:hypothetical protein
MTNTQRYNKVIYDIALKRNGITAESEEELTEENWKQLTANANGDERLAYLSVKGYFDEVGSDYLEGEYPED